MTWLYTAGNFLANNFSFHREEQKVGGLTDYSVVTNSECGIIVINSGDQSIATSTGENSTALINGYYSGDQSIAANTGFNGKSVCMRPSSAAVTTGHRGIVYNDAPFGTAISTGGNSKVVSSGGWSIAASTGTESIVSCTGPLSVAVTIEGGSLTSVEGDESIALAIGRGSQAKGALGCWIIFGEYYEDHLTNLRVAQVDGKKIKADIWYWLEKGEIVEV